MFTRCRLISRSVLLLAVLSAGGAFAAEKPLWELGIGMTGLSFPDYRGSDESSLFVIPFPYVVYRGTFLKADKDGVRGAFFDSDRVELNVSVGASVPVDSDDNRAREGMPDLQPTVEFGPSLDVNLWRTQDRRYELDLRLPARVAVTVIGGMDNVGWVFSPRLVLDITDVAGLAGWNLGLLAGPMFGSERNHEYFYSVAPQYATADRPAFDAKAGYAGSQFLISLSKRYAKYWLGAFARWDSLKGAAFADSPLVRTENYFAVGIGIAWISRESSTLVEAEE
ncbi:MAG: MipA/OmpV family protein [Lysobacterales bacterium]|nr:MAG: MipA/OmpV family protein [Xanthomonadales bacterium]